MDKIIAILFGISVFVCHGQDWNLIQSIPVDQEITAVSVDSKNMFYLGTKDGNVIRYAPNGEEDEYYSVLNNSAVATIQAWNRLKVFCFYRDQQTISILDRFTTTPKNLDLRDFGLNFAWLVAPGIDNSYWALSTELKELIKYDDQNLNVLFRIALPNTIKLSQACFLRAYKNLVIISDLKSGLWIFDQFGDYKGNINEEYLNQIHFKDGIIYATNGFEFLRIDPFKLEVLDRKKAPSGAFWSVVISGDRYVFFERQSVSIYSLD